MIMKVASDSRQATSIRINPAGLRLDLSSPPAPPPHAGEGCAAARERAPCERFSSRINGIGPLLVTASIALAQSSIACDRPTLISPQQRVIGESSPRIEWSAVANASHYLVLVESRVPEGRLLWREEFRTSATYLVAPRPLTADKATVKLGITAVCKDNSQSESTTRLRIDNGLNCRIDSPPLFEQSEGKAMLSWNALSGAQSYEVRAHSALDGKPEAKLETPRPAASLHGLVPGLWVLAVQPLCGAARGESHYIMAAIR